MFFQALSRYWLLLLFLVFFSTISGHASTISATSCSQADVQTAINSAGDGDVVAVPAGNCTWATTVTPPCNSWTLQGNGAGSTNITINYAGGTGIQISSCSGKSVRITGFTFGLQAVASGGIISIWGGSGLSFRLDHNTFQSSPNWGRFLWVNVPCVSPGCVIDHNTITNVAAEIAAELSSDNQTGCGGSADNCAGLTQWQRPMAFDNGSEIYFENNTFTFNNFFSNDMLDCINGGRYVFRYNTVVGNVVFDHGYDSVAESCLELTAYQNNMNGAYGGIKEAQAEVLYRGGTGVVYQNIMKNASQNNFLVTNYRSNNSGANDIHTPFCGGGNAIDGNITNGWQCYQQIGRGSGTGTPGLASYPLYEWDNCMTALGCTGTTDQNTITVYNNNGGTIDYTSIDIMQNRDFYDSVSPFTGATGVGIGTLASRPSTCTVAVAYWATDTNSLYQCSSKNTWTVYYTPYTYPHPLEGGGVAAPTNLTAIVN